MMWRRLMLVALFVVVVVVVVVYIIRLSMMLQLSKHRERFVLIFDHCLSILFDFFRDLCPPSRSFSPGLLPSHFLVMAKI